MPPPPRQHVPHAHHNAQAAPAAVAAMPAASGAAAGGERIICLGADGPLLKLPAAAFAAAPAVQLLAGGVAGVAVGQQQGQQQQQVRDQADPNSQVGVLIYLQDDTGKVSAYYVPTVATQVNHRADHCFGPLRLKTLEPFKAEIVQHAFIPAR